MGVSPNGSGFLFHIPSDYDIKEIGNKMEDFEILQKLGKGGNGYAIKVKSKKNYKIYVIKISQRLTNADKKEIIILNKLNDPNHPYICKCVTYFEENGLFYIVMDLYSNKDLFRYLSAYIDMNVPIKEENLWDIFNQCLEGLAYIHNKGIIHRDIKLANIFMNEDGKIVIGDFGCCAMFNPIEFSKLSPDEQSLLKFSPLMIGTEGYMAPEITPIGNYDQRVDVYSLGVCFYNLLYKKMPKKNGKYNYKSILLDDDNYYDHELRNIIFNMLEENPNERPGSDIVYKNFKKQYIRKYVRNSSIYSIVQCLFNFPNFFDYFSDNKKIEKIYDMPYNKKISSILLEIKNKNNTNNLFELEDSAYILRKEILENENIKIKDNVEVNPLQVINSILNSLYYELNEIPKEQNENICNFNDFNKFIEHFDKRFKSLISKNFTGVFKKVLKCTGKNCSEETIIFQKFNFITFNLENYSNYFNQISCIQLSNIFKYFNQTLFSKYIHCPKCRKTSKFYENKIFYCLPSNLIIMLDKSQCKNNIYIDFNEILCLSDERKKNNVYEYKLIGVISEIKGINDSKKKYISFIKKNSNWILCDNQSNHREKNYDFTQLKNYGNIIALFYYDMKRYTPIFNNPKINNNERPINFNKINEFLNSRMYNNSINFNNNKNFTWQMMGNNNGGNFN